jgi:hypothetical protein
MLAVLVLHQSHIHTSEMSKLLVGQWPDINHAFHLLIMSFLPLARLHFSPPDQVNAHVASDSHDASACLAMQTMTHMPQEHMWHGMLM